MSIYAQSQKTKYRITLELDDNKENKFHVKSEKFRG